MKKILFLSLCVFFLGIFSVDAQTTSSVCQDPRPDIQAYFDAGCDRAQLDQQGTRESTCLALSPNSARYRNLGCASVASVSQNPNERSPLPSQIQGTTTRISTNAMDAKDPATSFNALSPQSGSKELSSCNQIKFKSLLDILIWIKCIIAAAVIPLIFVLAFLVFLVGIFKFMAASESKTKEEGKKFILWGLIGLFVMVSVWGIIKILGTTFGFEVGVPYLQTKYLETKDAGK